MRSRITILCGFLLFSVMFATPAHAGRWATFVAWLSDLHPKTFGLGIEKTVWCTFSPSVAGEKPQPQIQSECDLTKKPKFVLSSSAAVLFGTLNESGGTIFVVPAMAIGERRIKDVYAGLGIGVIHVGGTLEGGVSRLLVQPRVTVPIPKASMAIRGEVNVVVNGFPAGTFGADSPATGTEYPFAISVIFYWR